MMLLKCPVSTEVHLATQFCVICDLQLLRVESEIDPSPALRSSVWDACTGPIPRLPHTSRIGRTGMPLAAWVWS